jgi:hypothetical protein
VLASLSGLSEESHHVSHLLALHPGALTAEQLARASALGPHIVLPALEQLVQRGAVHASGDKFSCASEALRNALCESRSAETTLSAHRALARAFAGYDQGVLEQRLATAQHLLQCEGDDAFRGACLLAQTGDEHQFELAALGPVLPLLETALAVLETRGLPDKECVGLLVPLSLAGFYGALDTQRRHLDRTMRALASICGITLAVRLRRWIGAELGLALVVSWAFVVHACARRSVGRRSFATHFVAVCGIPRAASAAFASAWDARGSQRVATWLDPLAAAANASSIAGARAHHVGRIDAWRA